MAMIEAVKAPMERRRAGRSHMIRAGQITFGGQTLGCVVLNLSTLGVKVHLPAAAEFPEKVALKLPDGAVRPARFCWRQENQIGFEFLD